MMQDAPSYPKKYWWLVVLVLPIVLGLIALLPRFLDKKAEPGAPSVKQDGIGNISQGGSGNVNIANSDLSSKMYVTNVSIIASEYAKYQGQALNDEELKRQIDRAVSEAVSGRHGESIRLFEELSRKVPLPAIYNNLGVEYAKAGRPEAAQKAFNEAIQKDPTNQEARKNLDLLTGRKRDDKPRSTSAAVKTEASALPAIVIEPLDGSPDAF